MSSDGSFQVSRVLALLPARRRVPQWAMTKRQVIYLAMWLAAAIITIVLLNPEVWFGPLGVAIILGAMALLGAWWSYRFGLLRRVAGSSQGSLTSPAFAASRSPVAMSKAAGKGSQRGEWAWPTPACGNDT